ncbi:MAG: hypothetical protein QM770_24530 [Tepidisphaeraceae bacterium]
MNRSSPVESLKPLRVRFPWRGFALGLLGVAIVCLFTPYNNYPLNNTDFIGNHLPLGVVLLTLVLVIGVNAPLSRWKPRLALGRAELTVALSMTLVASAFPSVGLMRYLPGHLAAIWVQAAEQPAYAEAITNAKLPDWLFPTFDHTDPARRGMEDVARGMSQRTTGDVSTFTDRVKHVPWSRWTKPAIAWGLFFVALTLGATLTAVLWHHQWSDVERLPFPLAGVWASLIEPPTPGRFFNALLASKGFWLSAAAVFVLQGWNALAVYQPEHFGVLPLGFNLSAVLADPPFSYAFWMLKMQTVYFTIIGLMFFVRGRVSFSLWFFFILAEVIRMSLGSYGGEMTDRMEADQQIGATTVMALAVLWVGRHGLVRLGKLMLGAAVDRHDGVYGPILRIAGWGLLGCIVVILGFFIAAGMSVLGAGARDDAGADVPGAGPRDR